MDTLEDRLELVDDRGWVCTDLGKYQDEDSVLTFKCKRGHQLKRKWRLFLDYHKCYDCQTLGTSWEDHLPVVIPHFTVVGKAKASAEVLCSKCGKTESYTLRDFTVNQKGSARANGPKTGVCCPSEQKVTIYDLWGLTVLKAPPDPPPDGDRTKVTARCSAGHIFVTSKRNLYLGQGCADCNSQRLSAPETVLGQFIKSKGIPIEFRNCTVLPSGREISILAPELGLGVCYHKIRNNSEESLGQWQRVTTAWKHRALTKKLEAQKKGVHLVFVFESDLLHHPQEVWDFLGTLCEGKEPATNDLRWVSACGPVNPPKPRYFDQKLEEVSIYQKFYTVWDLGSKL